MFRPNPAIIGFSSERESMVKKSMRFCNDEISPSLQNRIDFLTTDSLSGENDEILPSLQNRIDFLTIDSLSDENPMMAGLGRNM